MNPRKLIDYPELGAFLDSETVATTALPIDELGTIHAATMGYWHSAKSLQFYFVTNRNSEKCTMLVQKKSVKGACVVGTYKGTPFTLQMRGEFRIVDPAEHVETVESYYKKRGNRRDDVADPGIALLEFTPAWARFTDYSKGWGHFFLELA